MRKISLTVSLYSKNEKGNVYLISSATNTTDYTPGNRIQQAEVDRMIADGVTVKVVTAK
jgi:hypothetical protein